MSEFYYKSCTDYQRDDDWGGKKNNRVTTPAPTVTKGLPPPVIAINPGQGNKVS